jgi:ankyrin repeat protein
MVFFHPYEGNVMNKNLDILMEPMDSTGIDVSVLSKEEQLVFACKDNNLARVKELVAEGVDIHFNEERALEWACIYGLLEIVKYLVENGADIHVHDEKPLHHACVNGKFEVVKYIVRMGIDICKIKEVHSYAVKGNNNKELHNYLKNRQLLEKLQAI